MRQEKARVGQKLLSPTQGKCPSAGKQQREQFALLLPRQPGPPLPMPVRWVTETEQLSGNKLAFPNFALERLHWQNFKFFNQIQDHNIRQMLSRWLPLTVWSLSKSCFVFCDFYASIDVQYQTICNSRGKASYKFGVLKPMLKRHICPSTQVYFSYGFMFKTCIRGFPWRTYSGLSSFKKKVKTISTTDFWVHQTFRVFF